MCPTVPSACRITCILGYELEYQAIALVEGQWDHQWHRLAIFLKMWPLLPRDIPSTIPTISETEHKMLRDQ